MSATTAPALTTGERFLEALLTQSWERLGGLLAENVRYRGVTTSQVTEAVGRDDTIAGLGIIFDDGDMVTGVEASMCESLPPVERVSYRFHTHVPSTGELRRAEQHVFIRTGDNGQIGTVDLICSGWLPVSGLEGGAPPLA